MNKETTIQALRELKKNLAAIQKDYDDFYGDAEEVLDRVELAEEEIDDILKSLSPTK